MQEQRNLDVQFMPVDLISPGKQQARSRFNQVALEELAQSIQEAGIVQPLVVRTAGPEFELLAGERRWRAAQMAGLSEVPVVVRDDLSDREAGVLGLVENLQRESLSPVETARGLQRLIGDYSLTHAQAARRIGKSRVYVTNYLRLLHLVESVQSLVDAQSLSTGHAKVLAGMPPSEQKPLALAAIKNHWSVRVLEKHCARGERHDRPEATGDDTRLAHMEGLLSDRLGNRVRIVYSADHGRGELRIGFHNLDEFDGLLQKLGCSDLAQD